MILTYFFPCQHILNAESIPAADASSHLEIYTVKKEGMLSQHRVFFRKVSIPTLKLVWKELNSSVECSENTVEIPAF